MDEDFFLNNHSNDIPPTIASDILAKSRALEYHTSLSSYHATPLIALPDLAKRYGVGEIYCKDESFRFGLNAFKGLGASFAIHQLLLRTKDITTFCTATDGNHGKAVSWAAKLAGKKAVVFVPKDTVKSRIEAIEQYGAKVIQTCNNYDETCEIAAQTGKDQGWQLLQDTSWEGYEEIPALIMAGYLTPFYELENQINPSTQPFFDLIFLQAGVGSWAGTAIWYYLSHFGEKSPKFVIVEPKESDGILESFKAGERVIPKGNFKTIMAGLNCGLPSLIAWEIIKRGADLSMRIEDKYAELAIRDLYYPQKDDQRIISGESGSAGLAGLIALMTDERFKNAKEFLGINENSRILFFSTEGATDPENFKRIISKVTL